MMCTSKEAQMITLFPHRSSLPGQQAAGLLPGLGGRGRTDRLDQSGHAHSQDLPGTSAPPISPHPCVYEQR